MIKINNINKQYTNINVLNNISFILNNNEIVGLVGKNGCGKTTLLKIINKEVLPDNGSIEIQNEKIGYLPQNLKFKENETIENFLMNKNNCDENYYIDNLKNKANLQNTSSNELINNLSNGQKTRLYLTSLLENKPNFTTLLLDEPTNNLDIENITWLEKVLLSFKGKIILVSHDRRLLDNIANKIIEINNEGIKLYGGNYSFYKKQKEIEKNAQEKMHIAQTKKINNIKNNILEIENETQKAEKQFSSRMPYERRKIKKAAKQLIHKKRKLEKYLEDNKENYSPEKTINYQVNFSGETNAKKSVILLKNIYKKFGKKTILNNLSFHIGGGERVYLKGKNGSGKSTLMKIIIKEIEPDKGEIEIGKNINLGYFSLEKLNLNLENTVLKELEEVGISTTESYKIAIKFNINKEDLTKKIKELSMGQLIKIAFIKLTLGNFQLLILDEPTNHLDINTREFLEKMLLNYKGSILISSHDRYFLENIGITKTIEI